MRVEGVGYTAPAPVIDPEIERRWAALEARGVKVPDHFTEHERAALSTPEGAQERINRMLPGILDRIERELELSEQA